MGHRPFHPTGIHSCQRLSVVLLGQELRLEPAHLTGAGSLAFRALPSHDYSHGWVLGQAVGIVDVVVASQATEDRLAQQRNQVVTDIATSAAVLEVIAGDTRKAKGLIKLSEGQQSGVGGDGGTVKFQADFGVELEPEGSLFGVTHRVPP